MNTNQKIVAVVIVLVLIGMFLYPPFHVVREAGIYNQGYSFLLEPPRSTATVNMLQLSLQMFVAIIIGGVMWFVFKDKSSSGA